MSEPTFPVRVAVVGLGPIGVAAARHAQIDARFDLVALADTDPAKVGRRLVELDASAQADDVPIVADLERLADARPAVALVSTTSHFDRLAPTLRQLMRLGINVVSSCEELAWPWLRHPHLADAVANEAVRAGVRVLGTGVNPGFVMDTLPVALSFMTTHVTAVRCTRRVDALTRRMPLQIKIGAGMSVAKFRDLAKKDLIGHRGLGESVVLVAQGLGRHPLRGEVRTTLEPIIAERRIGDVEAGQVCGMRNVGSWAGANLEIELDLTMALGLDDPHDAITLDGPTPLRLIVPGGVPGDTATVAALVNAARHVGRLTPGLRTMLDLPPAGAG